MSQFGTPPYGSPLRLFNILFYVCILICSLSFNNTPLCLCAVSLPNRGVSGCGPYLSCDFPTTITISSPSLPNLNGKLAYNPMVGSKSIQVNGVLTAQLVVPHSADNNANGCNTYVHTTTDDGVPFAGNILLLPRGGCLNNVKLPLAESLKAALIILYDVELPAIVANFPPALTGAPFVNMSTPNVFINTNDGGLLAAAMKLNRTSNTYPQIFVSINGAGYASQATKNGLIPMMQTGYSSFVNPSINWGPNRDWADYANPNYDLCWDRMHHIWCENGEVVSWLMGSGNAFTWPGTINPSISYLQSLAYIDLSSMNLAPSALPSTMCNMPNLRFLNIQNNNRLSSFPDCFNTMTGLQWIQSVATSIPTFPTTFSSATNLFWVTFAQQKTPMTGSLPSTLPSSLLYFSVSANALSGVLPSAFPTSLQFLDLSQNQFSGVLPTNAFDGLSKLTSISLNTNSFSPSSLPTFTGCTSLTSIDLTSCNMIGSAPLSWVTSLTAIQTLQLSKNSITSPISNIGALNTLVTLNLAHNQISIIGAITSQNSAIPLMVNIAGAALQNLDLSYNAINGDCFSGFMNNRANLKVVSFAHNNITSLPPDFFSNQGITSLDFSFNNLQPYAVMPNSPAVPLPILLNVNLAGNPLFVNTIAALPSFVSQTNIYTKTSGQKYSCPTLAPNVASGVNPLLNVGLDANYYRYLNCLCDSTTYGVSPNCIPIPSNTLISPVVSLPSITTNGNFPSFAFSDGWFGTSRAVVGLVTEFDIDATNTIVVEPLQSILSLYNNPINIYNFDNNNNNNAFANFQNIQLNPPNTLSYYPITSSSLVYSNSTLLIGNSADVARVINLILHVDLSKFNLSSDFLQVYSGTSASGTIIFSITGDVAASSNTPFLTDQTMWPSIISTPSYQSLYNSKLSTFSIPAVLVLQIISNKATVVFNSRASTNTHFLATYTLSSQAPQGYILNAATNGYVPIVPEYLASSGARYAIYAASAFTGFLTLITFGIILKYSNTVLVRASSKLFTILTLVFILIMSCSSSLYGVVPSSSTSGNSVCNARVWLSAMSLMGVLSILFAKAFRISVIFGSRVLLQIKNVSDTYVGGIVLILLITQFIMLSVFSGNSMTMSRLITYNSNEVVWACDTGNGFNIWMGIEIGIFVLVMFLGAIVAFRTRNVPSAFNESSQVASSLQLLLFFAIILVPLDWALISNSPNAAIVIQGGGQSLLALFLLVVNFGPKLFYIQQGRSNDKSMVNNNGTGTTISIRDGAVSSKGTASGSKSNKTRNSNNTNDTNHSNDYNSSNQEDQQELQKLPHNSI